VGLKHLPCVMRLPHARMHARVCAHALHGFAHASTESTQSAHMHARVCAHALHGFAHASTESTQSAEVGAAWVPQCELFPLDHKPVAKAIEQHRCERECLHSAHTFDVPANAKHV
jgi:hypothetical protein